MAKFVVICSRVIDNKYTQSERENREMAEGLTLLNITLPCDLVPICQ